MEGRLDAPGKDVIRSMAEEKWHPPIVTTFRDYMPEDVEGMVWRNEQGEVQGLITWHIDGERAEVVTLDAYQQGQHIGGRLLDGAEAEFRKRGVRKVSITTTNDNLRAIAFYVRRGYRIVKIELDGMNRVRARKPALSLVGIDNIPLRDMFELEKEIP
jgi:GNAT superfamily N-acetyltransferase